MNESEPTEEASRGVPSVENELFRMFMTIVTETCLPVTRQALLRRHDLYTGLIKEQEKLSVN